MGKILEFGIKKPDEVRRDGGCAIVFDPKAQLYAFGKQENGLFRLFSGGVGSDENIKDGVLREVLEESGLYDYLYVEKISEALCHFHNSLKNVNRFSHVTCFLVVLKTTKLQQTSLEEHEKFTLGWAKAADIFNNWQERNQNKDYDHWIYFFNLSIKRAVEIGYDKTSRIEV